MQAAKDAGRAHGVDLAVVDRRRAAGANPNENLLMACCNRMRPDCVACFQLAAGDVLLVAILLHRYGVTAEHCEPRPACADFPLPENARRIVLPIMRKLGVSQVTIAIRTEELREVFRGGWNGVRGGNFLV